MMIPVHELIEFLGPTKLLGCGAEGCVYATDHDTVVKVTSGHNSVSTEFDAAGAFKLMWKMHPVVPRVLQFGRERGVMTWHTWIEREPLNDLQLDEQTEDAVFADDVGKVLGNVYDAKLVTRKPAYVPARDWRILTQMMKGHLWLREHGVELEDHNGSENWGLRADGTVAVRDLGQIAIVRETFERKVGKLP